MRFLFKISDREHGRRIANSAIAKPWFLALNAAVEVVPAMVQ